MDDVLGRGHGSKVVVIVFDRLGPPSLWHDEKGRKNLRRASFKAGIMELLFSHF